jgi:iron complex outermembrane receptor protein
MTRNTARLLHGAGAVAIIAGAIQVTGAANAQTVAAAAATNTTQLQAVVVTARRREENLQATPVSVSAVSAQTIERLNLQTADKLSLVVPNIAIDVGSGGIGGNTAFIRGIGTGEPLLTIDSPVGLYLDGVYLGRTSGNNFDMLDLAQVEVLRGPQGTLFGRNTTGGAINLVTKAPSRTFGIQEKVGYGSFDDIYSRTRINTGEIGDTGISAMLGFQYRHRNGYVDNPHTPAGKDPGALESKDFFAKIHGDWGRLRVDLTGDYDYVRGQRNPFQITEAYGQASPIDTTLLGAAAFYYAQSPNFGGDPFITSPVMQKTLPVQYVGAITNLTSGAGLTVQYDLTPSISLKSITAYRRWAASQPTNYAGVLRGPALNLASPTFFSIEQVEPFWATQIVRQEQTSEELQLAGKSRTFNWVAGFYTFKEYIREDNPNFFTIVLPPAFLGGFGLPAAIGNALTSEGVGLIGINLAQRLAYHGWSASVAGYGQASWRPDMFGNRLELTGGIRYTHDNKYLNQNSVPVAGFVPSQFGPAGAFIPGTFTNPGTPGCNPPNENECPRSASASYDNVSFLGSASYQWTPDFMTYGRISSGYKSGGFDARAGFNPATRSSYPFTFRPEKALAYEVGFKSEWFDHRLRANGDLFYTKYDDLQVPQYTGGNGFIPNANAHFEGFELEGLALPLPGVSIDGSVGYTHPVYDKFDLGGVIGDVKATSHFGYMPNWSTHIGGQYDFPSAPVGKLSARVDYTWTSERWFFTNVVLNPLNDAIKDPGHKLLSARLTLSDIPLAGTRARMEVSVFGQNLLDQQIRTAGIDFGPALGIAGNNYDIRRNWGVSLSFAY